jgi:hypothetical protein
MTQKSRWEDTRTCTSVHDATSLSVLLHQKKKKTEITHLPNTQKTVGKKMTGIRKSVNGTHHVRLYDKMF